MLMRQKPLVLNESQLLDFVLGSVVEDDCGAGTVKGKNSVDLFIERSANEFVLVEGPDGIYAANCEVGIDDG